MTDDAHLDGNVMGGLLIEVFGQEMTDARGRCAHCGDENQVGALIVYRGGPGDVTQVLSSYAFLLGVQSGALGRGAAVALLLFPILLVIVFFALRALKRRDI